MKEHDLTAMLAQAAGARTDATDWREYFHAIRERLWIVILCLVLGGIGAGVNMLRQETVFKARAVLFLEQEKEMVITNVKGVRDEQIRSLDMINTIVDLLCSYSFSLRVAERLKLNEDPAFIAALPSSDGHRLSTAEAAGALTAAVTAQYRKNTRLIDIFITHQNSALATKLVNAYADEYLRYGFEKRTESNKQANTYLVEEADRLNKKMHVSEEAMQSFRERERSGSIESLTETAQAKLAELTSKIAALEQKTFQLDADLKIVRADPKNVDELLRLPSVNAEPKIARYTESITDHERQLLVISQRYRAKHPAYIALKTQLDSLIADRKEALHNVVSLLDTEQKHYQSQYEDLKKARDEQEERLLKATGKSVEYNRLKRELEADRLIYEGVMSRVKEIDLTKGLTDSPVRIHESAIGAGQIAAYPPKVYGVGLLLGLLAGIGVAIGLHMLDSSVKTVEQAEQICGLPVLAAVAKKKSKSGKGIRSLDVVSDRDGLVAEAFRSLRASLGMLAESTTKRSFLLTSAMPSEGKTFCSANFAITLCQQGFRTLLIDADLRKPAVSPMFFNEHRKPGLSDVLTGRVPMIDAISATEIDNLSVLTAGSRSPNPAELLAAQRMQEVIQEALEQFDRVVIDTAPTLAVSDALLIAPHVDVITLVLRASATPRKAAARAVKSLSDINCRPDGVIFNCVPSGSGGYYSYYSSGKYSGTYGAKGVYGAKT